MLGFCFILVDSITVIWASSFSGHRFKLEANDFIFHILQKNFPKFSVKILALCSTKSLGVLIFPYFVLMWYILVQSLVETTSRSATLLKKRLWHRRFPVNFVKFLRTPLEKTFVFSFYYQVAYNCSN